MLNSQEEQLLKENGEWLPDSITKEMIESLIVTRDFQKVGRKTTVCCLTLKNGFEVIGTASSVLEQNFDADIGMEISEKDAKEKIWELQGYLLQHYKAIQNDKISMENSFGN